MYAPLECPRRSVYVDSNRASRSRYPPPESGGDPRRSPHRDRSPPRYNDAQDRGPFNGAPRENNYRPGSDNRNTNAFPARENYRETGRDLISGFPSREPPRGPKASLGDKPPLSDIPIGPRGNSFSHDAPSSYRGGFNNGPPRRGGAEFRGTSRDRAPPIRDVDRDFRERRENRGPSPERFNNNNNTLDRDFDNRNRFDRRESNYRGDNFRGRGGRGRAISPRGRPRSPIMDDRGPPPRPRGGGWEPRGRGGYRGRGRGSGYFSDTRSDVGIGRRRSRSPERERFTPNYRRPDESDTKPPPLRPYSSVGLPSQPRDGNPSPPPQAPEIPAFGTVVNSNIPNGPHGQHFGSTAANPIAIPTGPRNQRGTTIKTVTEHIWLAENLASAPPTGPRIPTGPSQSPVDLFHNRRPQSLEPNYRPYGSYHRSPQPQSRPVSRDGGANAQRPESPPKGKLDQDIEMMEAGEVDESPKVQREPTPPPAPKVDTISLVKRPTGVDMSFLDKDSDSDLEDDLGPEYFEKEIDAVKQEIKNASLNNVQLPTEGVENWTFWKSGLLVCNFNDELRAPIVPDPLPPIMPPAVKVEKPEVPDQSSDAMQLDDVPPAAASATASATPLNLQDQMEVDQEAPQPQTPGTATPSNELANLADLAIGTSSDMQQSAPKSKLSLAQTIEDIGAESQEEEAAMLEHVRKCMVTPPISSLPFRPLSPGRDIFKEEIENVDDVMDFLVHDLIIKAEAREEDIKRYQKEYKKLYKKWILFHHSDNELAVKVRQRWEANRAAEVSRAASVAPEKDNKPEGRSRGRFATEHDMERILKISELEAREEKARSDRAAKAKLADQREAVIPDMLGPEERVNERYGDATNRVSPERALAVFQVLPPIPDFTDHERNIFEATMLEYPKQWGKVANQLPGRNYKHVIQYYYLVKHELKLKEKLKRGLRGRKRKKPKTSVHTVALGREDDPEDPPPVIEEGGTRRRPKRAAAPTFGGGGATETAAPSESEGATPAPTSRRGGGTPKGEANGDAPTTGKRRGGTKQAREKAAKQAKNTQLVAAATSNAHKNREETKVPAPIPLQVQDWKLPRQGPPEPEQLAFQAQLPLGGFDGGDRRPQRPASHTPPTGIMDRAPPQLAPYEVAGYRAQQESVGGALPMNAYDQQTQRTMSANNGAPTSSYWSVSEAESFPALLKHFGTDWHGIAKWMASKTHIMVYTTVFQDWLTVPSDSNKSRRVANLAEQVKNYYQRQVDQGGKPEWEVLAREADAKKARGESTAPPPMPSHNPVKRKYDGLPGDSPSRGPLGAAGINPEDLEEMWGNGPTQQQPPLKFGGMPGTGRFDSFTPLPSRAGTLGTFEIDTKRITSHQHSIGHDPSPQPGASRFQPLAQGGQMADARSAPPTQKILPHQPQSQHLPQQMQQQPPGPQRGYFNVNSTDRRPILHARSSHTSVTSHGSPHPESSAHRSQAAKAMEEAQAEQQRAQRLMDEAEQAERARLGQGVAHGARMPMKVEPEVQSGLPPHLSPHVMNEGMFEHQNAQQQQAMLQQRQMGQRHDGGAQPISPKRPEERRPLPQQQQMPAYGQPFRGKPHPGQPQPQQIQSQRGLEPRGMESKMGGITTGSSTPIIAAHAPIVQGQAMRHSTMSAPPQQHPHVHAHHHHVHQHGMQQRHPSQQGQMLQGQPGGLQPHQQPPHSGQMQQLQKGQPIHPQEQRQQAPPPPSAPARKSNLFSLLNDDEPSPMPASQPKPSPSPVPFGGQQGYTPSARMSAMPASGPIPAQMQGREQPPQHMLRRETSHSDIRQAQQGPPQDMRAEGLRPEVPRRDTMPGYAPEQQPRRVPNPMAQVTQVQPQQARSHAGSHAGSPMERPLEHRDLVRDERGMIRGERDPRDRREVQEPPRDPRDMPRDPRDAQMRGQVDDRERENYYRYQQEEQRRQQMMMQQRQEQERQASQQGHSGHPGSHGSQSAVNSPQVVPYQPHPSQMQPGPPTGPSQQPQGHRSMAFGREQLGHGSRHSSFDGRERQMGPTIVASQGPPPTSTYVTSHAGQPAQHPSEQRGFPPQSQGPVSGAGRFDAPPPSQSAPPGPERGAFGGPPRSNDGRGGAVEMGRNANGIVNAKAVANNQYAPVYATREQLDAQLAREQRAARGMPEPPLDPRERELRDREIREREMRERDGRPDPRDPRTLLAQQDPRDPRAMPPQGPAPRDMPRDPRDPRDIPQPSREMGGPRTYTPNPMMQPGGPDGRGVVGVPAFGFQGSEQEMRERERLLERERQAEMENARLGRFGRS